MRDGRRRLLEGLGIVALSVLLLGVLELGLRVAGRLGGEGWPRTRMVAFYDQVGASFDLYRRHPFLNTAPRESHSASAFGKRASFNSLGYRSPERPLEKPADTPRVVFAGGSTTFDLLAAGDEATWPRLLEERWRRRGCPAEAWNAGFPGWTSAENAIGLVLRDLDLDPDVAVLFQGINDLQPASLEPLDRQYENHAAHARRALGFELRPLSFFDRSLLLEKARDVISGPEDPWSRVGPSEAETRRASLTPGAVEVFERNVRAFAHLAEGSGARPVLVTQTVRLRRGHEEGDRRYLGGWVPGLEPESVAGELERLNDVLRRIAGEDDDVFLVDAARQVDWRDEHFGDAMHFSAAGSERFAELLAPRLAALICGEVEPSRRVEPRAAAR